MPTLTDPAYTRQARAYLQLRQHWRRDPVAYVHQRFGVEPTWQQVQILEALAPPGAKVSVRSGHGIGKSSGAAWVICWFLETHDFAKVPCTSPSSHQLRDVLWGELAKWRRHADEVSGQRGDYPALYLSQLFHLTMDRLTDPGAPDWGAVGRTARKENPEALQGFHAQYLLYVLDEASGVDEAIYEAAEGALSTPDARVLMLGNPTRTSGTFHASHHKDRGSYTTLHFRSDESPLVDLGYRPRLVRKWGEGSNVVRVRCDGEFPRQEDDVLIALDLTEPCLSREPEPGTGPRILGVDVSRMGSDRTPLLLRQGRVVDQIKIYAKQDLMETVGCIVAILDVWRVDVVRVDLIGLGSGVHDRLAELKRLGRIRVRIEGVDVSAAAPLKAAEDDMQAYRLRDYLWLQTAAWLRDTAPVFAAEDREACEDLAGELASVRYTFTSDGALQVEDKDAMKKRLGHSPDLADALCLTFAPSATLGPIDLARGLAGLTKTPITSAAPGSPSLHQRGLWRSPGSSPRSFRGDWEEEDL